MGGPAVPVEPPATRWVLPDPHGVPPERELLGVGADLAPGTILAAYRSGLFPMPVRRRGPVGWWSPQPRGVIPLDGLQVSRSLRRALRAYEVTYDTAFDEVVRGCADPRRPHGWITPAVRRAYLELHRLGWAHSVETRTRDGALAGGLYGLQVGGLFAGESMFHVGTDASKVALVRLVQRLQAAGPAPGRLLDVQWSTPHLASLGAVSIPREEYLRRLALALTLPPAAFDRS
jgi:leucyl/phenylalanyl-tRNA--protein transferase